MIIQLILRLPERDNEIKTCQNLVSQDELTTHIYALAADSMMGRGLGSKELEKAAEYIGAQFNKAGLSFPPGLNNYYQEVAIQSVEPPNAGEIRVDTMNWICSSDFVVMQGDNTDREYPLMYLNFGMEADYEGADIRGKILLVRAGEKEKQDLMDVLQSVAQKREIAQRHGAAGLIELLPPVGISWSRISRYLSSGRKDIVNRNGGSIMHIWLNDEKEDILAIVGKLSGLNAKVRITGLDREDIISRNVIGIVEGKDRALKNEYIAVTAHYDHVGIGRPHDGDSIYNGARDNAVGAATLIMAAKYLKAAGTKRSVIFIACMGEEEGMLGSMWYVNNPVVPLEKTVYNLNTDGAGYNDTTLITMVAPGRTTIDDLVEKAANSFGLSLGGDPAPEQMFYERSDNISFARKGIPAVNLSPGCSSMDSEIMKYYHMPGDEPESLNYNYLTRYIQSFCLSLKWLADSPETPFWEEGDQYEKTGMSLYGSRP
ncbi:MAG TPA: M28 family peptidase [Cyclobacteriaceae bacterium]|nr:M28 family peptidase [Cyclobacteriaceae bacterium]